MCAVDGEEAGKASAARVQNGEEVNVTDGGAKGGGEVGPGKGVGGPGGEGGGVSGVGVGVAEKGVGKSDDAYYLEPAAVAAGDDGGKKMSNATAGAGGEEGEKKQEGKQGEGKEEKEKGGKEVGDAAVDEVPLAALARADALTRGDRDAVAEEATRRKAEASEAAKTHAQANMNNNNNDEQLTKQ